MCDVFWKIFLDVFVTQLLNLILTEEKFKKSSAQMIDKISWTSPFDALLQDHPGLCDTLDPDRTSTIRQGDRWMPNLTEHETRVWQYSQDMYQYVRHRNHKSVNIIAEQSDEDVIMRRFPYRTKLVAGFQEWFAVTRRVRAEAGDANQRPTAMKKELSVGVVKQTQTNQTAHTLHKKLTHMFSAIWDEHDRISMKDQERRVDRNSPEWTLFPCRQAMSGDVVFESNRMEFRSKSWVVNVK